MDLDSKFNGSILFEKYGMKLWERRHAKTTEILSSFGVKRILDIGCNDGSLIKRMKRDESIELIVNLFIPYDIEIGLDISEESLAKAIQNSEPEIFHYFQLKENKKNLQIKLFQADLLKDCSFLKEYDIEAITSLEVIEHIYKKDIDRFALNIFGMLNPKYIILSTPNYDFNYWFHPNEKSRIYPFRHWDHKFEMTQEEFKNWCLDKAKLYDYIVEFEGEGLPQNQDLSLGYCTQFAIFKRIKSANIEENKKLLFQEPKLIAEISFPSKSKVNAHEKFFNEVIYSYFDLISSSYRGGSIFEIAQDLETAESEEDEDFIKIDKLLLYKNIKDLVKNHSEFIEMLKMTSILISISLNPGFKEYTVELNYNETSLKIKSQSQIEEEEEGVVEI